MPFTHRSLPIRCRSARSAQRALRWLALRSALVLGPALLVACGGGGSAASSSPEPQVLGAAVLDSQSLSDAQATAELAPSAMAVSASALPPPDPGLLLLLLPDDQDTSDARVQAWIDAAIEEGVRLQPISDSAFLALGDAAQGYAGLVLPDDLHVLATDSLLAAVQRYTEAGGKTLLCFDFGALTLAGDVPVYPVPKSRLSGLAGVDYVLYDQLRERTTGLGPVTGLRGTLRSLLVPPGKSMPFTGLAAASSGSLDSAVTFSASSGQTLLSASGVSANTALYLPVSTRDAGGARGFDPQQYSQQRYHSAVQDGATPSSARPLSLNLGRAQRGAPPSAVSTTTRQRLDGGLGTLAIGEPLEAWSGYQIGPLLYPSYVTQGEFGQLPGQRVLATSPQFGLVAGLNPVGAGQVLFVNLPLTYLKGRTDALMMHGFLHHFVREVLQLPHLSSMPQGVAGITLDWHLDSMAAQAPTRELVKLGVFSDPKMLFSIEMTAGPDAITPGDRLGWNLAKNKTAQNFLRSFASTGHALGSHGGWIHDFYGFNVTESNPLQSTGGACVNSVLRVDNYLQCLVLNRQGVDGVLGTASLGYSAPEGNNPLWAMDWLERQGVVATYFGGHTGLGATRQYREGALLNPKVWVFPVTPMGLYATFEEFQAYGVPQSEVIQWYRSLIDFNMAENTSRMVYAHPPGAQLWSPVLLDFLNYAKAQGSRLSWYTMVRLARFMAQRQQVRWSQSRDASTGKTLFSASHPSSLAEMTWRLPRALYPNAPQLLSGSAVVDSSDARYWLVRASGGTQLSFSA